MTTNESIYIRNDLGTACVLGFIEDDYVHMLEPGSYPARYNVSRIVEYTIENGIGAYVVSPILRSYEGRR